MSEEKITTNRLYTTLMAALLCFGLSFAPGAYAASDIASADTLSTFSIVELQPYEPSQAMSYIIESYDRAIVPQLDLDSAVVETAARNGAKPARISLYALPYSLTLNQPDWHRLWVNSAVYAGAFVGTLVVLECLPEDATTWNRAAIREVPPFTRWYRNVFKKGPEWDHDNPIFNYVLHPYAGAVYFMAARGAGFNFYRSLLYSAIVSNIGWEFGIEAFMERPSYQDLIITPLVGSLIGECFYKLKRHIVAHDYTLWGSRFLGNVMAFLVDPVNEVVGLFAGNEARKLHLGRKPRCGATSSLMPAPMPGGGFGFAFSATF